MRADTMPETALDTPIGPEKAAAAGSRSSAMRCRHCDATEVWRWGRADNGRQRWRCCDCRRTFSANTGTALARLRKPGLFARLLADMAAPKPLSCRGLAEQLNVDRMTVWHWRRKAMCLLHQSYPPDAAVTVVLRESRKASREWLNHRLHPLIFPKPDRLRWIDYSMLGITAPDWLECYRVNLAVALDQAGKCRASILPPHCVNGFFELGKGDARGSMGERKSGEPASRAHDRAMSPSRAGGGCAETAMGPPVEVEMAVDERPLEQSLELGLRQFLRPFRGPATRHLAGYLNWFAARVDGSLTNRFAARLANRDQ